MPKGVRVASSEERLDLFWSKVDALGACWEWSASRTPLGYGRFFDGSAMVLAHRFAYTTLCGGIPDGLDLDHLCRNPCCVNPDHLEPVSRAENSRRGASVPAVAQRTGRCPKGHSDWAPNGSGRTCRICKRHRERRNKPAWRARVRESGRKPT